MWLPDFVKQWLERRVKLQTDAGIKLRDQGDLSGSRELLERTSRTCVRCLDKEHYETFKTVCQLGRTYRAMGEYDKAIALHEILLTGDYHKKKSNATGLLKFLLEPCEKEAAKEVRCLIDAGAYVNEHYYPQGSLLIMAISKGYTETAKLLLKAKADVKVSRKDGATPLSLALENGFDEIVALLRAAKAFQHKIPFSTNSFESEDLVKDFLYARGISLLETNINTGSASRGMNGTRYYTGGADYALKYNSSEVGTAHYFGETTRYPNGHRSYENTWTFGLFDDTILEEIKALVKHCDDKGMLCT
jgi:hypothetical protein